MKIPISSLSEKCQTTLPSEIRDMFGIKANEQILWIQVTPGLISLASVKKYKKGSWTKSICGKYANKVDAVKSLLDDRKEDLILEERGYLNK
jgi:bifunctional DNA-binding transcriptional regulator/antitoxin component of YhaV-PrlF toxin-antitoxin module